MSEEGKGSCFRLSNLELTDSGLYCGRLHLRFGVLCKNTAWGASTLYPCWMAIRLCGRSMRLANDRLRVYPAFCPQDSWDRLEHTYDPREDQRIQKRMGGWMLRRVSWFMLPTWSIPETRQILPLIMKMCKRRLILLLQNHSKRARLAIVSGLICGVLSVHPISPLITKRP